MSIRSRLGTVLRARRAQEDIARGDVARANAALADAHTEADTRATAMSDWPGPRGGDSKAYLASMAAGQALAHALGDALEIERTAGQEADAGTVRLQGAARRRRSVEKLTERAEEAERKADLAAQQRVVDDLWRARRKEQP